MGKPEPDVFLLAAERLGASPKECLVIEDGIHGMVAARKAGMYCVGLVRDDDHDINVYPADILVKDLREVRLEDL
jgi:beta-phosphoglucomutase-like phosphatase (HAD superfamily)